MGHSSTLSCAKTDEPIEMLYWMKTRVGPRKHVLDGGADPPREGAIFGDCPGYCKALAVVTAAAAAVTTAAFAAKGIIQSLITSCSRRDYSVCQASANSILKISGRR